MRFLVAFITFIILTSSTWACNVPVFRYALERWHCDPFRLTMLYEQSLPQDQLSLINRLQQQSASQETGYNFVFDIAEIEADAKYRIPDQFLSESSAVLQVEFPLEWGPLHEEIPTPDLADFQPYLQPRYFTDISKSSIDQLLHSPIRDELAKRLIDGQTAVWVFVDGQDPKASDEAYETLVNEVQRLEDVLELPDLDDNSEADTIELGGNLDEVRIEFSILRLSKDDPSEAFLLWQLMHIEPDLIYYKDQPMAFPIYGRGRALYALIGSGINQEMITTAGSFLVGPCTCQIKDDNPGKDLLIGIHWESHLEHFLVQDKAPPIPFASIADTLEANPNHETAEDSGSAFWSWQVIALALGIFVIVDIAVLLYIRRRNSSI